MTRITAKGQENSVSAMKDLFKLYKMRDPMNSELGELIEIFGTHAAIALDVIVYDESNPEQSTAVDSNNTQAIFVFTGLLPNSLID